MAALILFKVLNEADNRTPDVRIENDNNRPRE